MHLHNIVLFDNPNNWKNLLPLTATRAISDIRIGILQLKEKWQKISNYNVEILSVNYLNEKYKHTSSPTSIYINSSILPNESLWATIEKIKENEVLYHNNEVLAFKNNTTIDSIEQIENDISKFKKIHFTNAIKHIKYTWDIFKLNGQEIVADIKLLKLQPNPDALSRYNTILGNEIYVSGNVVSEASTFNTLAGPIFLGNYTEIMEGCTIRAPFALCEHSTLKMQTKIYGDTTIGPHCKVGGEVSNSVILGYSNKAHDGFLGNAVIGEWCNLGADTNNSNLKNNYGNVKVWNYNEEKYVESHLQFLGLIMGDHAKAAINTQFNTGTVVGVCANVFDAGFPPKFVPDFSWGSSAVFSIDTAFEVAQRVMERRKIQLTAIDKKILAAVFEHTQKFRP